jgi:hypothetical protein
MKIENGKMIYGKKDCQCEDGTSSTRINCLECNGTGKGKRGAEKGCKKCYGTKFDWDHKNRTTCDICKGEYKNFEDEIQTDYIPEEMWEGMNFKVYRHNRQISLNESVFGLNCVYSCSDYGRTFKENNDEKLIQEVKSHNAVQASSIVDKNDFVCDHIGIFVSNGGYSVRPVFNLIETIKEIALEKQNF